MVHGLRLPASTAGGAASIPGGVSSTCCLVQPKNEKKIIFCFVDCFIYLMLYFKYSSRDILSTCSPNSKAIWAYCTQLEK